MLSKDPWGAGWMIRLKPEKRTWDGLMDATQYEQFVASLKH